MIIHVVPTGDGTSQQSYFQQSITCNCACQRCLAGDCCLMNTGRWPDSIPYVPPPVYPYVPPSYPTVPITTSPDTNTPIRLWPRDADGQPLVGYWRCTCGTVVPPGLEHRCPPPAVAPVKARSDEYDYPGGVNDFSKGI